MFKTRFISMLVLLAAVATGARAQWTGETYTATATENLGAITVNADATLTINEGVTVTVNGGINVASGTLTVTGPGTLVVTGAEGNDGANGDWSGGTGGDGGVAISGNIIVEGGATVTATGGTGGNGGSGSYGTGGTGGTGGVAISGNIIVQGGATVTATGGNGGNGGNGFEKGGNGGNGGNAFAGTLTYKSGTVTANGGSGGSGGTGEAEGNGSSGSAGKAFANDNDVDFTQSTGYSVTDGTSTITTISNQRTVVISGGTPIPTGYSVSMKEGTDDATNWQGKVGEGDYQDLPLTGLEAGTAVSVKYNGTKKVKSVKAKKKAAAEPAGPTAYTLAESTQGMIVGTDGKAYDVADKDNLPTGVTAAGVVVYKNGSNGLAIALTDEASTMYWSTANGETGAAAHTPTVTGYSWRLPSMDEWKQMFGANGGNNESYTGLNTAINTAGGTALLVENGIYWTCTETAYSGHYIAFLNANVSFFMDDDNNANRIRACIAF